MSYDCSCDYDPPAFCNVKTVKARKTHKCEECCAEIPAGAAYEYTSGLWDDCLNTFKICQLCVELRQWATISVPCFCWGYGNLHDDVREMVDQIKGDVPGVIFEWGRRMIKIERVKYGRHWPRRPNRIARHH